jgi:hypothetical protein
MYFDLNYHSLATSSHFRTKDQDEVDLVLEDRRGLRQLQAAVGNKFVQGLVLHDHDRITPFDEKLHAGSASLLWQV